MAAPEEATVGSDAGERVSLALPGHGLVTVDLVPNQLLSDAAGARRLGGGGSTVSTFDVPVATYRGTVHDAGPHGPLLDGWTARLNHDAQGWSGLVWSDLGAAWAVFPTPEGPRAVPTSALDLGALEGAAIDAGGVDAGDGVSTSPASGPVLGQPRVVRLAVEVDHGKWSRNQDTWAEDLLHVLNLADGMFDQIDVRIEVVWLGAWTEEDPFTATRVCSSSNMLSQFRVWWNQNRVDVERDEAYLVGTLLGGPIGCAYLRQLATSAAYAVSKTFSSYAGNQTLADLMSAILVAHEMGHNFDGRHERSWGTGFGSGSPLVGYAGTIMNPTLTVVAPRFSGADGSVNTWVLENAGPMRSYAASRLMVDPQAGSV